MFLGLLCSSRKLIQYKESKQETWWKYWTIPRYVDKNLECTQSVHLFPSLYSYEAVLRRWVRQLSKGQVFPGRSNRGGDRRSREVGEKNLARYQRLNWARMWRSLWVSRWRMVTPWGSRGLQADRETDISKYDGEGWSGRQWPGASCG